VPGKKGCEVDASKKKNGGTGGPLDREGGIHRPHQVENALRGFAGGGKNLDTPRFEPQTEGPRGEKSWSGESIRVGGFGPTGTIDNKKKGGKRGGGLEEKH